MRFDILISDRRKLVNGGAMLLLASLAAGCSSQVSRFNGVDDVFTASTSNQQQVINGQGSSQAFPGDQTMAAAPVAPASSGSVSRGALSPVAGQSQPMMAQAPAAQPSASQLPPPAAPTPRSAPVVAAAQPAPMPAPQQAAKPVQAAPANNTPFLAADKSAPVPSTKAPAPQQVATAPAPAPVAATKPATVSAGGSYTIAQGDTLSRISQKTGVSVAALKQANNLQDSPLKIGQTLTVPASGAAPVVAAAPKVDKTQTAATAPAKPDASAPATVAAYTPPKKGEKLVEQASLEPADAPNATGIGKMRWPVRGRVISSYGKGGGAASDGIDIAVPEGTPIKAAENGVVIYAGNGLKEFGNTVLVRHEDGLVTVYGHTSEIKVQRGQKVKRGDDIALSGMSGTTDAPKLHFEVRKNSAPVDPSTFLE
ncbi:M23 family metallopeptidase [Tianweitania sp. Rool2]|uniref:M23 family metallopeptidase n=2 Tax=Oryzicola mucosus TaxID=2767425 RepID=A0A8J6U932_9HYPH|nr:M23 family metallopeptidase [Oryzicola mucosus]MBD0416547.1 M23 family metallopeptidase [Oryzicola mucosus]